MIIDDEDDGPSDGGVIEPTRRRPPLIKTLRAMNVAAAKEGDLALALDLWRARGALTGSTRQAPAAPGFVSIFKPRTLAGYLYDDRHGEEIELRLNDRAIYSTIACQKLVTDTGDHERGFRIPLKAVWRYLGAGDRLQVTTSDGQALNIVGFGDAVSPWTRRKSKAPRLFARLDEGYALNKWGQLQKPLNADVKLTGSVMRLFQDVVEKVEARFDGRIFIFYGTLLGAIRSGDFIGHDDDIDALYMSRHRDPAAVKQEFIRVCEFLRAEGYRLKVRVFGTKVLGGSLHSGIFGLHYGHVNESGAFDVSFGYHGPVYSPPAGEVPLVDGQIGKFAVKVPSDSEPILEMLYTGTWRVPDPGFSHHTRSRLFNPALRFTKDEAAQARGTAVEDDDDTESVD